jgi:hypothetical protein
VLAAHRACGLVDARLRFLAASADGGLRAMLPFVRNGAWTGARRSHAVLPPLFAVNGTPLVAAHGLPEAIDGLLDGMAAAGALWRLPMLSIDGRIGRELTAACARRGFPVEAVGSFERAVLHRRAGYEAYARDRLSPNRRKGLRRRLKRLEAQGRVAFATFKEGEGLRQAVEAFLALEAAGGKAGAARRSRRAIPARRSRAPFSPVRGRARRAAPTF